MLIGIDASRAVVALRTGTERYGLEISRALIAANPSDRFVLYFNRPPPPDLFPTDDHAVHRVIPAPRFWTLIRLSVEMARRPPDVLFVPSHSLPLVLPRASVATIHDLGYLHFPSEHGPSRWLRDLANRWSAARASRIITVSAATRDDLIRHYRVSADRITVIHHGVDPSFGRADAGEVARVRGHHGLDGPYFLFVGTLQPRKNYERLLAAFDRAVARDARSPSLAIVGALGWQSARLQRAVGALSSSARQKVRLLGYVSDGDLPALLTGATALAFPSLYEGFGLPALEAMACGTPVLTSSTSSLSEVVGEAGLLVDPLDAGQIADALRRLAADVRLRGELASRGRERAAAFTWERAARQTLEALHEAAGGGPDQTPR